MWTISQEVLKLISANLRIHKICCTSHYILNFCKFWRHDSNCEVDKGASISSPYQVINRENTNGAESLSSPLWLSLQLCSVLQTYYREQLHRFRYFPEEFQSSSFQVRIDCFLYGRNRKRGERSASLASYFSLLPWDRSRLWSLKIIVYPIPVEV